MNDRIVFKHDKKWFMLYYGSGGRKLMCAYANNLKGKWKYHKKILLF